MRRRIRTLRSTDDQTDPAIARTEAGGRPPDLFVVDDDVATLELLCEIGRDAGWVAHGFTKLSDLRASLDEAKPSLLILDDDLPDGRGGDMARDLRDDERLGDVPLLVCTAAHPMRRAEIGAWAPVVSKPFDLDEIDGFLRAAAARHNGSGSFGQRAG
jgi:DNA-binding response OmpR family regulator